MKQLPITLGMAWLLVSLQACGDSGSSAATIDDENDASSSSVTTSSSSSGTSSIPVSSSSLPNSSSSEATTACTFGPGQVILPASGQSFAMGSDSASWLVSASNQADSAMIEDLKLWGLPESPIHTVSFTYDFQMDSTEATQGQMACALAAVGDSNTVTELQSMWQSGVDIAAFTISDNHAAFGITMLQAALYANARSTLEGLEAVYSIDTSLGFAVLSTDYDASGYRLPTEAEWEFAARGGTTSDFYWDRSYVAGMSVADSALVSQNEVWTANSGSLEGSVGFGPQEVATRQPNAFGLYDMLGNVSEMCNSSGMLPVSEVEEVDPQESGALESLLPRGGNWANGALRLRVSNRTFDGGPTYPQYSIGLRLVKAVVE